MHIITRMDMGGSAQNTLLTCSGLSHKYDTILVHGPSHESEMTEQERRAVDRQIQALLKKGVKVHTLRSLVRRPDPINDPHALWKINRLIRKEKIHVVHTHTSKAGILGRWAAWLSGVSAIVHTAHGHVFYGHFDAAASRIFLALERVSAKITHRTIALTESEGRDYVRLRVCEAEKLSVVHSGVDIERFKNPAFHGPGFRQGFRISADTAVVGFVGWLLPIKDPATLLRAMGKVWEKKPETVLVFVGKGDLEAELKSKANLMGAGKRVLFFGWREDIPMLMQGLDIFVLPSRNEGMGRVLIEAMAAGKPVVASRAGGIPDLVREGENGFLFRPGDSDALARHILRLAENPEMRKRMGEKGGQMAQNYSIESMIQKIDGLYTELLEDKACMRHRG